MTSRSSPESIALARAHFLRGNALREQGRREEALHEFRAAVDADPELAEAHVNLGHLLELAGEFTAAAESYDHALRIRPDLPEALQNLGTVQLRMGSLDTAIATFRRALDLRPDNIDALVNLGIAHRLRNDLGEAEAVCRRALGIRDDLAVAWINLANIYRAQNRMHEARDASERALALAPDSPQAHVNAAMVHLVDGRLSAGWPHAEFRHALKLGGAGRSLPQPQWLGDPLPPGARILLHAEQGFGDTLLFVRFVPLVAACGARVILEVQPPLKQLVARSMSDVATVIAHGEPLPDFELHCPLPSLPLAFRTELASIPATVPYLRVPEEALQRWHQPLESARRPRVGLAWAGNPTHPNDQNRSVPLAILTPLLARSDLTFLSLKKEVSPADEAVLRRTPGLHDLSTRLVDFSDTAAAISAMDLVIAVDTSVAHLAGALGRPLWVLLPFSPDWRWLLDRRDSPWYPTARLFRQPRTGDWESVIAEVARELDRAF